MIYTSRKAVVIFAWVDLTLTLYNKRLFFSRGGKDFALGAIFLALPLASRLDALCGRIENLGPTGYTPCEPRRFRGGTACCASLCDALAEQSSRGSLTSELVDSLMLDYVASGSNRSHRSASLNNHKQKRDNREGYLSGVGGACLTKVEPHNITVS